MKVKHDNGVIKIRTTATNEAQAIKQVAAFENCPESAIFAIQLIAEY